MNQRDEKEPKYAGECDCDEECEHDLFLPPRPIEPDPVQVPRELWVELTVHLSWLAEDSHKYAGTEAGISARRVWNRIKKAGL